MEVSVENTSTLGRRLKVSVSDAAVKEQIKQKLAKLAKEVSLKGFRRGKVPLDVIQKRFGKSVRQEVIEEIIRQSLGEAVEKNDLRPAGMPRIEEITDNSGDKLEYVAAFEVYPQITLSDLSEIQIEKRNVSIADSDVENMITKLTDQFGDWHVVERAIKNGDKISVDFARKLNKDHSEREEQKNVQMIVGEKGVLPELNKALLGKVTGDEIEVNLTYPQDWPDMNSKGEAVTLWVTILKVEEKEILTKDALIEKLSGGEEGYDIVAKIRESMEKELEAVLRDELKENVLEKMLAQNPIEVPQALIDQEKQAMAQEERARLGRGAKGYQVNLDTPEMNEEARKRVELGLLLNEVIRVNQLKVEPKDIRAEIDKIAAQFSGKSAEIAEMYSRNTDLLRKIERKILLEHSIDAILGKVKITEKQASFDEVMNPMEEENQK